MNKNLKLLPKIFERLCRYTTEKELRQYYFDLFFEHDIAFHGVELQNHMKWEMKTVEKTFPLSMSNATIVNYLDIVVQPDLLSNNEDQIAQYFSDYYVVKLTSSTGQEWSMVFNLKPSADLDLINCITPVFLKLYNLTVEKNNSEQKLSTDSLTGLYCLKFFMQILEKEISRAKRLQNKFSILFFDINRFKEINLHLGHLQANNFLTEFANILNNQFRLQDTISRFGGDEFIVLLPETDREHAKVVANRVEFEFAQFVKREYPHIMSFGQKWTSFGVSSYPVDGRRSQKLIAKANRNMFDYKKQLLSKSTSKSHAINKLPLVVD